MDEKSTEFTLIKNLIIEFIETNKNNSLLSGIPLKKESVEGIEKVKQEDLWYLGEWVIIITPDDLEARWSYEWTEGEDTNVILHIKKMENQYKIINWDVEQTF